MPKYDVTEVLDIIMNLEDDERLEILTQLKEIQNLSSISPIHSSQKQTQTIHDLHIEGNQITADLGQKQVIGGNISTIQKLEEIEEHVFQDILELLASLKAKIISSIDLDLLERVTAEAQIRIVEDELQKAEPDRNMVSKAISLLKQGLMGAFPFIDSITKISSLLANIWGIPMP